MGFALYDLTQGGTPDYAGQAAKAEKQRQQAIDTGLGRINNVFGQFDPQFYQQRAQAYTNFAMPQLGQQYRQTRNQIGFNLANRNLTGSSTAGQQWSDLARSTATAKRNIADVGTGQAQQLQRQVEDSKNTLIGQLYQSADPATATQQSISAAASFQQPSVFAPLANQFSGLLNQYYINQLLNQRVAPTPIQTGGGYGQNLSGSLPATYSSYTP